MTPSQLSSEPSTTRLLSSANSVVKPIANASSLGTPRLLGRSVGRLGRLLFPLYVFLLPLPALLLLLPTDTPSQENEAEYRAAVKLGLKSAAWWANRLCEPLPKPAASSAASRAAAAPAVINKVRFKNVAQVNSISAGGPSRSKRAATIDDDEEAPESDIAPQTPAHRPARRRRRVVFPEVSPFMRPAPPAPLTTLEVHVFGRIHPVPVTRKMALPETLDALQASLTFQLDMDGYGLADRDGGEAWTDAQWEALKKAWMMGGKAQAWLIAVG